MLLGTVYFQVCRLDNLIYFVRGCRVMSERRRLLRPLDQHGMRVDAEIERAQSLIEQKPNQLLDNSKNTGGTEQERVRMVANRVV